MGIQSVACKFVATVSEDTTIDKIAQKMREDNVGTVIITNNKNEPRGIVTDRDIVIEVLSKSKQPQEVLAKDIMQTDLLTLQDNCGINDAIKAMQEKQVRRAPMVDSNNQVCGIVSIDDLIVMLATELNEVAGLIQAQEAQNNKVSIPEEVYA